MRDIKDYLAIYTGTSLMGGIGDDEFYPLLTMVDSLYTVVQNRYLYFSTRNSCEMNYYLLDTQTCKIKKYHPLTKYIHNALYFVGDENYGCDDQALISISNPKNIYQTKNARFDALYNS
jgi:hypothetical protein